VFFVQRYPASYIYSQLKLHFPVITAKLNTAAGSPFAYVGLKELDIDMLTRPSSGLIDIALNSVIVYDPDDYHSKDVSAPPFLLGRPGKSSPCIHVTMDDYLDSSDSATIAPLVAVGTKVIPPPPCILKVVVQPLHFNHSQRVLAGFAEFGSSDVVPDAELLHVEPPAILPADMHIGIVLCGIHYSVRHESRQQSVSVLQPLPSPVTPSRANAFTTPAKHHDPWSMSEDPTLRMYCRLPVGSPSSYLLVLCATQLRSTSHQRLVTLIFLRQNTCRQRICYESWMDCQKAMVCSRCWTRMA
jgi:hypothetical protein